MPASITKAMTTLLAFDWIASGKIDLRQRYVMDRETFAEWASVGSTMYLPVDALASVDDLLAGTAAVSANDGAVLLARGAAGSVANWTAAMTRKARSLGMVDSRFNTPNGWMDEGRTFTTARDLGRLGTALATRHPTLYDRYVGQTQFVYNDITQYNHDPITGRVPGADGIKTGFTNQAGHGFLGSAERDGRRLVMVIAASPRQNQRNRAARRLIEWGFAAFDSIRLFGSDEVVGLAEVQGGSERTVALVSPRAIRVTVPRGARPDIKLSIRYAGPVRAPFKVGQRIAALEIHQDDSLLATAPLYAATAVEEANWTQSARNALISWFS